MAEAMNLQNTLEQAAEGNADAWRTLVDAYTPRVFGLLVKQCGDRELAEEITQATFVRLVTHLARYDEQGRFEPWLFRIAMNQLRDEMRRRKRQAKTMDMTPGAARGGDEASPWAGAQQHLAEQAGNDGDPSAQMAQGEQIAQLKAAIAQLPEADREILHLRHTAGMSFQEIAEALDQPLGTVLARGHRALGKLRKMMMEMDNDDGT